jgi:hypothetical protein
MFKCIIFLCDRFCGLVVRVPGHRSSGPCSIPGATIFSEKLCVWNGIHSASWVQLMSYLKEKNSGCGLENQEYGRRDPSRWPRGTLYPQNLALNSLTSGCRSVGIIRSRTQATEFFNSAVLKYFVNFYMILLLICNTLYTMQFILDVDYRLCRTLIIHQQFWGYEVEGKLHLGVRTRKIEYHWCSKCVGGQSFWLGGQVRSSYI